MRFPRVRPVAAALVPVRWWRPVPMLTLAAVLLPTGCKRATPMTDASLAQAVQSRLSSDTALGSEPIQTTVDGAVVTLSGTVSSDAARALAASDASQVSGVRTVVNDLVVNNPPVQPTTAALPAVATPIRPTASQPVQSITDRAAERKRRREQERAERAAAKATQKQMQQMPDQQVSASPAPAAAMTPSSPQPPAPVAPPAPVVRNVTLQAGTILSARLSQTLDSASTQLGQSFSGTLAADVIIDGVTVLRQGSNVSGQVTAVREASHFKGNSLLSIALTGVTHRGDHVALSTESYTAEGKGRGTNTAEKVGGGAAVGAILGGIFGGGRGAAIGAAAGGGTGAGINGITRGEQVQIPAESLVRFRLASPVTLRVLSESSTPPVPPEGGRRPLQ